MFKVGDKVRLRADVLQRHARSIPAHLGYTTEEFRWRDTLRLLKGVTGVIERRFENSKHVNVQFPNTMIGIDDTELDHVAVIDGKEYVYNERSTWAVQSGKGDKGSYRGRYSFHVCENNALSQAVFYYRGINIGNGYKKRLLLLVPEGDKTKRIVVARAFS